MVRVIRMFRPLAIVSAWSGTPNDGHGHHQTAGLLTQEAYRAAGDPSRFPRADQGRLEVWQVKKLYLRSSDGAASPREFQPSLATLSLNTGEFDPLLGCSYYELAARGRSQHRSQDQGTIEARGPRYSRLRLIDSKLGTIKNEKDIFDDIDTTLVGIANYTGAAAPKLRARLTEVQAAAVEARAKFNPLTNESVSAVIARGLKELRAIRATLGGLGLDESELFETDFLLKQKEADFVDALLKSDGVVIDCLSDDEVVTQGQTFNITLSAYANASAKLLGFGLVSAPGWTVVKKGDRTSEADGRLVSQSDYTVTVSADIQPTRPYWLNTARKGDMFTIDNPAKDATGIEPVAPSVLMGVADFSIAGEVVKASQEVEYRFADRAVGEIRRDLKVTTPVSVNVSPEIMIYPKSTTAVERELVVTVTNNQRGGVRGLLALQKPDGWLVSPPVSGFEMKREGERAVFNFAVKAPAGTSEAHRSISAVAMIGDRPYVEGFEVVAYPHIESRFIYREARAQAEVIDVKIAPGLKVGYIEGAGDDIRAALERIGFDVKTIDSQELASGDLSVYDVIVAGVRVYEVRPDVIANNARLMEYVNRGGTYIVQYSRGNFETGGFAPYRTGREDRQTLTAQRDRQADREREPRILYLSEADVTVALSKSATKPKIGFIGATNHKILESLRSAGLDALPLAEKELAADISQLDVIIVGSDASKRSELAQFNAKLLEYSRRKLVIATYSQAQFIDGNFPSYPKPDARPFRVTDELAKVTILEPNHPRFNFPNKITQRDFDGWVQERGAYFLGDWDSHFKPLMASHDPGEPDLKGGEVIAEYGKGLYVYTAYAWFRQLPKGVSGAYRLIANLVSLPKAPGVRGQSR